MALTFDTVEEYWTRSDAADALNSALRPQIEPITQFEKAFSAFVGGLDAAFLVSGREAIYQALQILNVGDGDEVILPAFVCEVVAEAVLRCKAIPVLVDVELPGGEINLALVLDALSAKTRAVLIPHLFGVPVDFQWIKEKLKNNGVAIIEDCSHCLGGTIRGKVAGSLGSFSIFSFNYDKPISLGNGGMLVCSDPERLDSFKRWKMQKRLPAATDIQEEFKTIENFLNFLINRRTQIRQTALPTRTTFLKKLIKRWILQCPVLRSGYNQIRLTKKANHLQKFNRVGAVRALLGLSLLRQYPVIASERNQHAKQLLNGIRNCNWAETDGLTSDILPTYLRVNVFAGGLTTWQVDYLAAKLCQAGFRAGRLNWPVSLDQIPYLSKKIRFGSMVSNASKMAGHCLNLPIHQNMGLDDIDRMVDIICSRKI